MNCCDDNGRCTCGQGEPARPVRSCDELGLCQGHIPRCTGCTTPFEQTVRGVLQEEGERPLSLAPGVLEGYRVPRFGTPSQRRELARWLLPSLGFTAVLGLAGLAVGVVSGRFFP